MAKVRVLVGTKKGAFICTSDDRKKWSIGGPHFAGWEIYHMKGSPVDPNRIYCSQTSSWFGQVIQRSDDGGKTWDTPGSTEAERMTDFGFPGGESNKFVYDGVPGEHKTFDGTSVPWVFKRVWHLEPSLDNPDVVYAGAEDAAIFRSDNGGASWTEMSGLRKHTTGKDWQPGAGGMCLHTILIDPKNHKRMYVAISAAGCFRTDDGGETWKPINKGLRSQFLPQEDVEVGHCVHRIAFHPSNPDRLYMQKHWDIMVSDNAGDFWTEKSDGLPSDFGFPIDVHAHEPETIYVVPIQNDSEHFVPEGKLRVYRSKTGGNNWEPLTNGLPQENCYVNVLREAMAVDRMDDCGIYFGTTSGEVYCSPDGGDHWHAIGEHFPGVLSVEVQTLR